MIINVCSCELLDNLDHAYEILALADIIRSQFEGKWPFPLHCGHSKLWVDITRKTRFLSFSA